MEEDHTILWEGTISSNYKKFVIIIYFIIGLSAHLVLSFSLSIPLEEFILYLLIYLIFILSLSFLLYYRWHPQYRVTPNKLISKKRDFLGRWRTKSLAIKKIKTIYIVKSKRLKDTFHFFQKTVEELFKEHRHPKIKVFNADQKNNKNSFNKESRYPKIKFLEKLEKFFKRELLPIISKEKFYFEHIDSPNELLTVLQSLIPIKKHPTWENTYERAG